MTINMFKSARDVRDFEPGQIVFKQGEPGDALYAVVDGRVDITLDGNTIETVTDGGFFGEMALVDDDHTRSATAVAGSPCRIAVVDQAHFTFLVQEHPTFALQVMRAMARRIRDANARA